MEVNYPEFNSGEIVFEESFTYHSTFSFHDGERRITMIFPIPIEEIENNHILDIIGGYKKWKMGEYV